MPALPIVPAGMTCATAAARQVDAEQPGQAGPTLGRQQHPVQQRVAEQGEALEDQPGDHPAHVQPAEQVQVLARADEFRDDQVLDDQRQDEQDRQAAQRAPGVAQPASPSLRWLRVLVWLLGLLGQLVSSRRNTTSCRNRRIAAAAGMATSAPMMPSSVPPISTATSDTTAGT